MTSSDYMVKAYRALASARILLADGDTEGACNRAYYAMFDAAHAALLHDDSSLNPAITKTHRGLIAVFGKELVKAGRVPADSGRSLNQVERIRLLADYTGEGVDQEKARWAVDQADAFLVQIERFLL